VSQQNGARPIAPWVNGPMVGFDLETTGVDVENDRIVTATVIDDTPGFSLETRNWLVNPGVDIPTQASDIHGVTTAMAQDGMEAGEAVQGIAEKLRALWGPSVPLVIYNAPYDLTLFDRELQRHGHPPLGILGPVLCPLTIDRAVNRYRPGKRTLSDLCVLYGVELVNAHTSAADVAATLAIMRILGNQHSGVSHLSLDALNRQQKIWYRNWSLNFAGYLARTASEMSPEEWEKLRRSVRDLKKNADNWPMIPRPSEG
jgi:DNA polymerase III subunit epsilon